MQRTVISFYIFQNIHSITFATCIKHNRKQIISVTCNIFILIEIAIQIVSPIFSAISFNHYLMHNIPKWSDTLLKILQQMLQDLLSVSVHFETLCLKLMFF